MGFRVLNRYIERERLWVRVLEGERGIGCLGFKQWKRLGVRGLDRYTQREKGRIGVRGLQRDIYIYILGIRGYI